MSDEKCDPGVTLERGAYYWVKWDDDEEPTVCRYYPRGWMALGTDMPVKPVRVLARIEPPK